MELKDYLRVIRRRLGWFVTLMIVIIGGYLVTAGLTARDIYVTQVDLIAGNTTVRTLFDGVVQYFPNVSKLTPATRVESLKRREICDLAGLYLCDARESSDGDYLFARERKEADKRMAAFTKDLLLRHREANPGLDDAQVQATFEEKYRHLLHDERRRNPETGKWEGPVGKAQEFRMKAIADAIGNSFAVAYTEKLQIISLTCQADSPKKAVAIANAVADAAVDFNQELDQRDLSKALVHAKQRILGNETRLTQVRNDLKNYWKQHNISENEYFTSAHFYHQIESLQGSVESLREQLAKKDEEELKLDEQHKLDLEQFPEFSIPKDSILNKLLTERSMAEQEVEHLLAKYTEVHPEVVKARRAIVDLGLQFDQALVRFKEHDARNQKRDKAILALERSYLNAEIARKLKALEALDDRRVVVDQLKVDERTMTNLIQYLEEANTRLTSFIANAEMYADASTKPLERMQTFPLDPDRDWTVSHADPFQLAWFVTVIAFLLSLGVVFLVEYMDTTLKTEQDVRRHLNQPILGVIPRQKEGDSVILTDLPVKSVFAEQFYTAATILRSAAQELKLKTFVVASTIPQEGKTTITVNLGIALARKGFKVLIVDSDLRIPQVHETLGLENTFGVSSILEGRLQAKEILSEITDSEKKMTLEGCLLPTAEENLRVIPSGPCPADPMNLLESVRMKALVEELKDMADFVLFDTPPLISVCDALPLAEVADAVLFVVSAGAADRYQVTRAKHLLSSVEASVMGCILNHVTQDGQSYYYYHNAYKSYRSRA